MLSHNQTEDKYKATDALQNVETLLSNEKRKFAYNYVNFNLHKRVWDFKCYRKLFSLFECNT